MPTRRNDEVSPMNHSKKKTPTGRLRCLAVGVISPIQGGLYRGRTPSPIPDGRLPATSRYINVIGPKTRSLDRFCGLHGGRVLGPRPVGWQRARGRTQWSLNPWALEQERPRDLPGGMRIHCPTPTIVRPVGVICRCGGASWRTPSPLVSSNRLSVTFITKPRSTTGSRWPAPA